MKTILRIIVILLVASAVAGAFSLAVNNSSTTTDGGQMPTLTDTNGQTFQPTERPEGGDRDDGSLAGGLAGVLGTLAKLTGITVLVLVLQKGFEQISSMKKWKLAQR